MWRGKVLQWTGLVASFLCAVCSGIFLSFNVYAVQMKAKLELNQTEVEIVGSFTLAGLIFSFVGYILIAKYGFVVCYVTAWALVTSSDLLMWLATVYSDFFGKWIALVCLFQILNTVGASVAEMCCISFGLSKFHKRHAGKIIGVYLAGVALGKVYYAALYKVIFQTEERLGAFFLSVPIGFTATIAICIFCQRSTPACNETDTEQIPLTSAGDCGESEDKPSSLDGDMSENKPTNMSLKDIAKSWEFHLFLWPSALFVGCSITLMNNITTIGQDIGMEDAEVTIYILSVGIIISRASFGLLFDYFETKKSGMLLLIICQLIFAFSMVIGWFWLDSVTIIIMALLSSVGAGPGFSLSLAIIGLEFGLEKYNFLMGVFELGMTVSVFIMQFLTGISHDHLSQRLPAESRCYDCFHWCFILLFCCSLAAASLTMLKVFLTKN